MAQYKNIPELSATQLQRFWSYVERRSDAECWPWSGPTTTAKFGATYGAFRLGYQTFKPHRVAYLLAHGSIDPALTIDHLCQNKLCMNPWHLEQVELAENVRRRELVRDRTRCKRGHQKRPHSPCRVCDRAMQWIWNHGQDDECSVSHPGIPLKADCPACAALMERYRSYEQHRAGDSI